MRSRRHWPVLILSWQCQSAMAARRKSNILDNVSTNDGTQGNTATQTVQPGRRGRPRSTQVRAAVLRAAAELTLAGGPTAATVDAIAYLRIRDSHTRGGRRGHRLHRDEFHLIG